MNRAKKKVKKVVDTQNLSAKKRAFLEAYKLCATVTHAAITAKISRCTHYDWLEKDKAYVEAFKEATIAATDTLIEEARRRAIQGVSDPVYHGGKQVGSIQKYSDTLLIFLMKGAMPEKYRDNHHITGSVNVDLVERLIAGRKRVAEGKRSRERLSP